MDETKLTDEEIVKAIDKCFEMPMKCEDGCPYFNKYGRNFCVEDKRFYHDLKDLIHRLQADNRQLKGFVSGLEDEKKVESIIFGLKETIGEQKAEIERLKKEKAESAETAVEVLEQNLELQKQVDKAWFEVGKMCMEERKDTAKEIFDGLAERKERVKAFYGVAESVGVDIAINTIKEILKQKGVEVE